MSSAIRGCLLLVVLGAIPLSLAEAQILPGWRNNCCHVCQRPRPRCGCAAARPVVRTRPVVQTQYRQQQIVTYRDVQQTQYRRESYLETVPVTAYQNVVVDEGSYQQVWVSKPVTKQVARTVYQQRQAFRTVPYQVTRRIPQVSTQLVPHQVVRHVPTTYHAPVARYGCNTCGPTMGYSIGNLATPFPQPWTMPPITTMAPTPVTIPLTASLPSIPTMPAITIPPAQTAQSYPDPNAVPEPLDDDYDEFTIQPRHKSGNGISDFNADAQSGFTASGTSRRSSVFVPAPTAANVWRYRESMGRRQTFRR